MLRATVWTVGLFGAGTAISRLYPGAWTEPLVLLGLGLALLFVSARTARGTARPARVRPAASAAPSVGAKPAALPAPAIEVERTA